MEYLWLYIVRYSLDISLSRSGLTSRTASLEKKSSLSSPSIASSRIFRMMSTAVSATKNPSPRLLKITPCRSRVSNARAAVAGLTCCETAYSRTLGILSSFRYSSSRMRSQIWSASLIYIGRLSVCIIILFCHEPLNDLYVLESYPCKSPANEV